MGVDAHERTQHLTLGFEPAHESTIYRIFAAGNNTRYATSIGGVAAIAASYGQGFERVEIDARALPESDQNKLKGRLNEPKYSFV